jgi:hypothetical protein
VATEDGGRAAIASSKTRLLAINKPGCVWNTPQVMLHTQPATSAPRDKSTSSLALQQAMHAMSAQLMHIAHSLQQLTPNQEL